MRLYQTTGTPTCATNHPLQIVCVLGAQRAAPLRRDYVRGSCAEFADGREFVASLERSGRIKRIVLPEYRPPKVLYALAEQDARIK